MTNNNKSLLPTLKSVFGFDALRPSQESIVESVMDGRDVLALLKTSGGKSLCFQLPAVHRGGMTLVISPLISLMKDQVDALLAKGIKAAYVNSNLTSEQISEAYRSLRASQYQLFYVAPERFQDETFIRALLTSNINTVAIDEAHCASQWGHDFRPHYSKIGAALGRLDQAIGKRLQRLAFTATATERVQQDICEILQLNKPAIHQQGFDRENLTYSVLTSGKQRDQDIEAFLNEHPNDGTIIYCVTVKRVEELTTYLKNAGLPVDRYHGRLSPDEKNRVQEEFIQSKTRILVSTSAFGMGVDKADIRLVIHAQMPGSLESWYQEAGRAGRDGLPAKAVLFYDQNDRNIHRFFIELGAPGSDVIQSLRPLVFQSLRSGPQQIDFKWFAKIARGNVTPSQVSGALNLMVVQGELARHDDNMFAIDRWQNNETYEWVDEIRRNNWQKVNAMQQWCETTLCRRWTILKYFGEKKAHARCGTCDTCQAEALSVSKVGKAMPYVRPVTLMNFLRAVDAVGQRWKPVLLGTINKADLKGAEEPWLGRFAHYAVGDLDRWHKRLCDSRLLSGNRMTERGENWINGRLVDSSLEDSLCRRPEPTKSSGGKALSMDMLYKWRKIEAYAQDTSEMAVATEAVLRKLTQAPSCSEEGLSSAGLSSTWIRQYSKSLQAFHEKISNLPSPDPCG